MPAALNEEQYQAVLDRIAKGDSVTKICEENGMPSERAFYYWLESDEKRLQSYTHARDMQAEKIFSEIIDIADTEEDPTKARVRIDARKWVAGKLKPKKYGDKLDVEHNMSEDLAALMDSRRNRANEPS